MMPNLAGIPSKIAALLDKNSTKALDKSLDTSATSVPFKSFVSSTDLHKSAQAQLELNQTQQATSVNTQQEVKTSKNDSAQASHDWLSLLDKANDQLAKTEQNKVTAAKASVEETEKPGIVKSGTDKLSSDVVHQTGANRKIAATSSEAGEAIDNEQTKSQLADTQLSNTDKQINVNKSVDTHLEATTEKENKISTKNRAETSVIVSKAVDLHSSNKTRTQTNTEAAKSSNSDIAEQMTTADKVSNQNSDQSKQQALDKSVSSKLATNNKQADVIKTEVDKGSQLSDTLTTSEKEKNSSQNLKTTNQAEKNTSQEVVKANIKGEGKSDPSANTKEPSVVDGSDPFEGTKEPPAGTKESSAGTKEPLAGTKEPLAGTKEPLAGGKSTQSVEANIANSADAQADVNKIAMNEQMSGKSAPENKTKQTGTKQINDSAPGRTLTTETLKYAKDEQSVLETSNKSQQNAELNTAESAAPTTKQAAQQDSQKVSQQSKQQARQLAAEQTDIKTETDVSEIHLAANAPATGAAQSVQAVTSQTSSVNKKSVAEKNDKTGKTETIKVASETIAKAVKSEQGVGSLDSTAAESKLEDPINLMHLQQPEARAQDARSQSAQLQQSVSTQQVQQQVQQQVHQQERVHAEKQQEFSRQTHQFKQPLDLTKANAARVLNESVKFLNSGKVQAAELRLDPADLGSMKIQLNLSGDQASVSMLVQNQQARDLLEQSLPKLREMLQEQGLELADADVSQQQDWQQGESFNERGSASNNSQAGQDGQQDELSYSQQVQINNGHLGAVDYYA
ncbi:flagellar hook-length control protein FliK [Gayadomonas joobiniege]|uniref:flagellar hook-length control protein FliK n=1 Tax=Gayadomonas joobiniege TaxID=1234606 RepID=UPI0003644748|nr:flagellar hook-length control protein FliK [Gayadomonas joobiniege]